MRFLKNNEINEIKQFIRKENVELLKMYFESEDKNEKVEILKKLKDNYTYLYVNENVKGATR